MAIVANRARAEDIVDGSFCTKNRTNAGSPNTALTPQFAGEIVEDTTGGRYYVAVGLTNTSWVLRTDLHTN